MVPKTFLAINYEKVNSAITTAVRRDQNWRCRITYRGMVSEELWNAGGRISILTRSTFEERSYLLLIDPFGQRWVITSRVHSIPRAPVVMFYVVVVCSLIHDFFPELDWNSLYQNLRHRLLQMVYASVKRRLRRAAEAVATPALEALDSIDGSHSASVLFRVIPAISNFLLRHRGRP